MPCILKPPGGRLSIFHWIRKWYIWHQSLAGIRIIRDRRNGACVHYVMVSKIQWRPFWLATHLYPQNDSIGWQKGVNNDVFAQASSHGCSSPSPLLQMQRVLINRRQSALLQLAQLSNGASPTRPCVPKRRTCGVLPKARNTTGPWSARAASGHRRSSSIARTREAQRWRKYLRFSSITSTPGMRLFHYNLNAGMPPGF